MGNFTKTEIENIVDTAIDEFIKKQLDSEVAKLNTKNGSKTRDSNNELIKNGIEKLAQFLWMQKATWKNNIK